jgi:hypothetical protein
MRRRNFLLTTAVAAGAFTLLGKKSFALPPLMKNLALND